MDGDLVKDKYKTRLSETTEYTKERKKWSPEESEPQYYFQGQSARSQHWFDLNNDWIEEIFMTR